MSLRELCRKLFVMQYLVIGKASDDFSSRHRYVCRSFSLATPKLLSPLRDDRSSAILRALRVEISLCGIRSISFISPLRFYRRKKANLFGRNTVCVHKISFNLHKKSCPILIYEDLQKYNSCDSYVHSYINCGDLCVMSRCKRIFSECKSETFWYNCFR